MRERSGGQRSRSLLGAMTRSMRKYAWVGPFRVDRLLADAVAGRLPKPPIYGSAYVVTQRRWRDSPSPKALPLYVGGNSGRSSRFRTRLGDLIADAFGFFGGDTGHHSGGQSLHRWCKENCVSPLTLYVGWVQRCACHRCVEMELFEYLSPSLNRVRPSRCPAHSVSKGKK